MQVFTEVEAAHALAASRFGDREGMVLGTFVIFLREGIEASMIVAMSWRQLPRNYYAFALVLLVGYPLAMIVNGQRIEHFGRGLAIVSFMLWRLARRGHIMWALLLVWNVVMVLAFVGTADPSSWTPGAPLFFLCMIAPVALLLSRSMREHVGVRGPFGRRGRLARV